MKAYIFPGQGAQFSGMGKDLYEKYPHTQELFEKANDTLGFSITDVMFQGSAEDLKQTRVTQPAIFLHSVILSKVLGDAFKPDMVAGHSLGEYAACVAAGVLKLEQALVENARRYGLRFIGPNCLGIMRPGSGLNCTFNKGGATPGKIALVSQSGALCTAILDWSAANRIGFSTVVSTGISG